MTLNQVSDIVLPAAAVVLLIHAIRQLVTVRDRHWPFRLAMMLLALAIAAMVSAATFEMHSSAFQAALSRLAEGLALAALAVLAAAGLTGRIPGRSA